MGRLEKKTVIVSGGATRLSHTIASLFACEGANVVVNSMSREPTTKGEQTSVESEGTVIFKMIDVTKGSGWDSIIIFAQERFGGIDVLINNPDRFPRSRDKSSWDEILDVKLRGTHLGIQKVIPIMRKNRKGSIVNILSLSGLVGRRGLDYAQTVSDGGLRMLSKSIAMDYAPEKIRCNTIVRGLMEGDGVGQFESGTIAQQSSEIPLGRVCTENDIGFAALFLASDESDWMTGAELTIDGGFTAQ